MSAVGQQLAARRKQLDYTQQMAADRIGITPTTVSAVERGLNEIQRSKRADWERGLDLIAGTITRAYETGAPLQAAEPLPQDAPQLTDPDERLIWQMNIPERHRRDIIEILRSARRPNSA
ncbi:helix-turn-helix transcriptional regulator [Streptomyces sp. SHP 1-2]|uniref:helix-turn-helix transcriptional regulator n=1 Tax=Streptomyces sp. SHP 1-2 TaxID=2769489 RepID=UPI002238DBDE|nr:helix-turn-helix transcriptional regulator [Streptomyces sp. SHP 1-2]MCW5252248.1 helix-turn-helix transcriptional regulator [Streptomyces sp. SHP 1-2]